MARKQIEDKAIRGPRDPVAPRIPTGEEANRKSRFVEDKAAKGTGGGFGRSGKEKADDPSE